MLKRRKVQQSYAYVHGSEYASDATPGPFSSLAGAQWLARTHVHSRVDCSSLCFALLWNFDYVAIVVTVMVPESAWDLNCRRDSSLIYTFY